MGILSRIANLFRANRSEVYSDENDLFLLNPGDIVSIDNNDFIVDGVIIYKDGKWKWTEYKLKDNDEILWLSVEKDDEIEISLFNEIVPFTTEPFKKTTYEGIEYFLVEGSDAVIEKVSGEINLTKGDKLDYFEYSSKNDTSYLSVEIYDGEIEMSIGKKIEGFQVNVYKRREYREV